MIKKCEYCGGDVTSKKHLNQKFCSHKCYQLNKTATTKIIKKCKYCGKIFERCQSRMGKYCSRKCRALGRQNRILMKCDFCGKQFIIKESHAKKRRHCSKMCFINNTKKENSHRWKGGKAESDKRTYMRLQKERDILADNYIKQRCIYGTALQLKDIPQELIELKRTEIQLYRIKREMFK